MVCLTLLHILWSEEETKILITIIIIIINVRKKPEIQEKEKCVAHIR